MLVRSSTHFFLVLFSSFLSVAIHAESSQEPGLSGQEILTRFSRSSQLVSYAGDFTFEDGRNSSAYRVTHGVVNGKERQKIKSLNGPQRDFLVEGGDEKCNTIGQRLIQGVVSSLSDTYKVVLRGKERIANRNAWNILLVPKDTYRYGVSLSIDAESFLLLRYLIYNESQQVLERLQFISLQSDINLGQRHFEKDPKKIPLGQMQLECSDELGSVQRVSTLEPSWLPKGFVLSMSKLSGADGYMETYTDGLSAFSVFVSKAKPLTQKNEKRVETGVYRKGASVAVFNLVPVNAQPMSVTVVGEIPQVTAQKIALSMNSGKQ